MAIKVADGERTGGGFAMHRFNGAHSRFGIPAENALFSLDWLLRKQLAACRALTFVKNS